MNVQRNAATVGALLVLLVVGAVSAVASGVLAHTAQNGTFGLVLKTLLALAVLASTLSAFMRWGLGGSLGRWLGVAAAAYVLMPSSWSANTLFLRGAGVPSGVAWLGDAVVWMAIAWWTAARVLPGATRDEGVHRLR